MFSYFVLFNLILFVNAGNKCTVNDRRDFEGHLATKSPYRFVANKNDREIQFANCVPIRTWMIVRHGSRNPNRKVILRTKGRLTSLRNIILSSNKSKLCNEELERFDKWNFDVNESDNKVLVYEGVDELIQLAERMQKRFPNIFPDLYDSSFYKFKFTASERTEKSANSFCTGLFGRNNIKNILYPEALRKDPVLRFYKLCKKWKVDVKKNPEALTEVRDFINGKEISDVLESVKEKTGISDLTISDLHNMYTICAFETAWNKHYESPWCYLFDNNAVQILEFSEDLKYFWVDGYGYDINWKQACPAMIDMLNHIETDSDHPNTTVYFTHSGTILKMLAHLGLYKDNFKLKHTDFSKQRKWHVSKIDTFGSNIAFVSFKCEGGTKVLTLHQENIVNLPGCPTDEPLCDIEQIKTIYKDSFEHCHFDQMCDSTK